MDKPTATDRMYVRSEIAYWAGRLIGHDQAWEVAKEIVDEIESWRTCFNTERLLVQSYKEEAKPEQPTASQVKWEPKIVNEFLDASQFKGGDRINHYLVQALKQLNATERIELAKALLSRSEQPEAESDNDRLRNESANDEFNYQGEISNLNVKIKELEAENERLKKDNVDLHMLRSYRGMEKLAQAYADAQSLEFAKWYQFQDKWKFNEARLDGELISDAELLQKYKEQNK